MQSKSKKNSSQKKEKREVVSQGVVENHFRLGHCAGLYAQSLADPFTGPPEACMPVTPCIMSQKVRTFVRTQLGVGTGGFGFLVAAPFAANDGATTAGNIGTTGVYHSSTAYAGTNIPVLDPVTAGVIGVNNNSPFTSAQFGTTPGKVQRRLVSMGIRIRYQSTEVDRGGRILLLEDPDHIGVATNTLAMSTLLSFEKAKEHAVGTKWVTLCSTGPVEPAEYDFVGSYVTNDTFYLKCIIQAKPGIVFDMEVFQNWEFAGSIVRGKTYSESDDLGVSVVLGAIKGQNDSQLDSRHPMIATQTSTGVGAALGASINSFRSGATRQNPAILGQLVQAYASKNTSGWMSGAVKSVTSLYNKAKPYLGTALHIAEAAAPLLLM